MKSISANLNIMIKASEKASKALIRDFGEIEKLQVSKKGPADFVTNSDLKTEKIIIDELKKAKPNYSVISEENGIEINKDIKNTWIIDPIDGTINFLHGVPHFAISIALKSNNEITIRSPNSTRPWQFVIDPLDGYLQLAKFIHKKKLKKNQYSWNFAPNNQKPKNVKYIIDLLNTKLNKKIIYKNNKNISEKKYLSLSSKKAEKYLNWSCKYSVIDSINKIVDWEYNFKRNKISITNKQIKEHYKKY